MPKATELTLAFIRRRPGAAARVLMSLTAQDAAAFMGSIPTRYAVSVFDHLNASASASIIQSMDPTSATAAIRDMEFAIAIAVLRQLDPSEREACMTELPRGRQRAMQKALTFAPDSVGSRMTTDIPSLAATDTVGEALRQLRENKDSKIDAVFVVDDKRHYRGVIHVLTLLRHPETARLQALIDSTCPHVSPNARLEQVGELASWRVHRQLPVVSRRGELVGAIDRHAFVRGDSDDTLSANAAQPSVAGLLLGTMSDGLSSLLPLLAPQSAKPNAPGDSDGR